jgi:hypothetical protein
MEIVIAYGLGFVTAYVGRKAWYELRHEPRIGENARRRLADRLDPDRYTRGLDDD